MGNNIILPDQGGNSSLPTVANAAARLALNPTDGYTVIQLDNETIYSWDATSMTWKVQSTGGTTIISVTDTNSIDLTDTVGVLTADLKLSAATASGGNTLVNLSIQTDGLRAQIPTNSFLTTLSATSPIFYNNTTGVFSSQAASGSQNGYLLSTDWTTFNNKQAFITATTSADYYRGDKTFQTLNKAAVGLGNVDNTSDATKNSAVATLTNKTLTAPVINSPTGIVKGDVGLGNVDNTSDANKPVSTATQTALNLKADLASPTFTGVPLSTTAAPGTNTTQIATTAFVTAAVSGGAITIGSLGAGNANGLSISGTTLTLHAATSTQPGALTVAAQVIAGAKTFSSDSLRSNNATNASFVSTGQTNASSAQSVTNLQSCTGTFTYDYMEFVVHALTTRKSIKCFADYSGLVSAISDPSNLFLNSDAGTGIYISKSANSNVITFKSRTGSTEQILIETLNSPLTSVTVWS